MLFLSTGPPENYGPPGSPVHSEHHGGFEVLKIREAVVFQSCDETLNQRPQTWHVSWTLAERLF